MTSAERQTAPPDSVHLFFSYGLTFEDGLSLSDSFSQEMLHQEEAAKTHTVP